MTSPFPEHVRACRAGARNTVPVSTATTIADICDGFMDSIELLRKVSYVSKLVRTMAIMGPIDTVGCVRIFRNLAVEGLRFSCKTFSGREQGCKFYTLVKALAGNDFRDSEDLTSGN